MSRRRCDKYTTCEECDCYSQYTEKIKQCADEIGYEKTEQILELGRQNGLLSWLHGYENRWQIGIDSEGVEYRIPTCTKEQNCLRHYCNPNGIYNN